MNGNQNVLIVQDLVSSVTGLILLLQETGESAELPTRDGPLFPKYLDLDILRLKTQFLA